MASSFFHSDAEYTASFVHVSTTCLLCVHKNGKIGSKVKEAKSSLGL